MTPITDPAGDGAAPSAHDGDPLLPDVGILALGDTRWSPLSSSQERVMRELGRFFRIVWLNPPPYWRRLLDSPGAYGMGRRRVHGGVEVLDSDYAFPVFHRPARLAETLRVVPLRRARARLERLGAEKVVLYLWHHRWGWAADFVEHDASCYHVKDEYSYSPDDVPTPPEERRVLERADEVFVVSRPLLEKKGAFARRAALVPNGVDFEAHARPGPQPFDLARIRRPVIGYTGWIKRQVDWPLVDRLAERHPEWSFVFVGARSPHPEIEGDLAGLHGRANVHFLGAKPSAELARYPGWMDVCVMPYRVDGYTRYICPLKLHEYLAGGAPVVSSPIPAAREFSEVVDTAETVEEWSTAIRGALRTGESQEEKRRRQEVARRFDWAGVAGIVARRIGERLGGSVRDRVSDALADPRVGSEDLAGLQEPGL